MFENELLHEWGIWLCFVGDKSDSSEKYDDNFMLTYTIKTPSDLAYIWNNSPIHSLNNYIQREDNKQKAYLVGGKWKKVNSLDYFKKGIQPKWEDPLNESGGTFKVHISRKQENKEEVYRSLVFYLLGESYDYNDKINGFRFIANKKMQNACFRMEVWVNFDREDTTSLEYFQVLFNKMYKDLQILVDDPEPIKFDNNKQEPTTSKEIKDKDK